MAANSQNGNGSSDIPLNQGPVNLILTQYKAELEENEVHLTTMETQLIEQGETLNTLAEQHREPRNLGTNAQELQEIENVIKADLVTVLDLETAYKLIVESVADTHINLIRFCSTLDKDEVEQRNDKRRYRRELERVQRDQIEDEHHEKIERLSRCVDQCETNIQSLRDIRLKYIEVMKKLQTATETQESLYGKLVAVRPLIERNLTAIDNQKKKITQQEGAVMDEQVGPSGLQQLSIAEGGAVAQDEEKSDKLEEAKEETDSE